MSLLIVGLDSTIVNVALPSIGRELHTPVSGLQWTVDAYTLVLASLLMLSGSMADRFGRRRVFELGLVLFTLGSLLCGLSGNIHLLVACRILQGCGGAMMVPVGRLTLVRSFAKSELVRTLSFVAIPSLVAPMLGPVTGGLIVGYFHWRAIFFVNVPMNWWNGP